MLEKDGVEEEEGTVRSCSHRCLLYSISGAGGLSHAILGARLPSVLVVSVSTASVLWSSWPCTGGPRAGRLQSPLQRTGLGFPIPPHVYFAES